MPRQHSLTDYGANGLGGGSATLVDKVVDGTADIVWTLPSYTPGRFPKSETFELPGLFAGPVATNQALWDFYNAELTEEFDEMKVLLLHTHAGQAFMSTKPIRSAADLKGMAVRTPGNTGTLWLKAAGANPVQAPVDWPEVFDLRISVSAADALITHALAHKD